jgi:hypothetical protein
MNYSYEKRGSNEQMSLYMQIWNLWNQPPKDKKCSINVEANTTPDTVAIGHDEITKDDVD